MSVDITLINDGEVTTLFARSEPVMAAATGIVTAFGVTGLDWDTSSSILPDDVAGVGAAALCPDCFKELKARLSRAGWTVAAASRDTTRG